MTVRFGYHCDTLDEAMGELYGGQHGERVALVPDETGGWLIVDMDSEIQTPPKPRKPYVPKLSKCRCVGIKHPQGCNQDARFLGI